MHQGPHQPSPLRLEANNVLESPLTFIDPAPTLVWLHPQHGWKKSPLYAAQTSVCGNSVDGLCFTGGINRTRHWNSRQNAGHFSLLLKFTLDTCVAAIPQWGQSNSAYIRPSDPYTFCCPVYPVNQPLQGMPGIWLFITPHLKLMSQI